MAEFCVGLLHRPVHPERAKAQKERIMLIGKFIQEGDVYKGHIVALGLVQEAVIVPMKGERRGERGPDFVVRGVDVTEDGAGAYEVGAAWTKTSKAGKAYLSVKLDSPFFPAPVNCALIKQPDGTHALVWNRDDRKADEEQAAA
jgi:uncharacterized protein (DUF736 family)